MESTFIILTQIITFGTAWSMFHCVLKRKKKDWFSLVGALGYLLLPYHVYVVTESGSVTDSDMDGGADPGSVSDKNVGYGENVLEDRLWIDRSIGPGDYRKTGWRSRVDAFVPDLRGWYLPETMAISGDRNSGSCHGIPHLYDVETLAVRRVLCGERIGIYQHHGAGIQYRRSVQYLFL